ncbi:MAG: 16S rRNA (cytosine(1402)-N(4))-methyltransferase RsmH [Atribacterota bacterium]|nr:16S rRNA (cytosine(1402)-N(4))-methyltransferase RsmH [Atribacterota bacterium]MDD4895858.1 16S rRNA (cytosine(1402)-N(4))-methyltransferase RsmH [Atribacterota bacterium]MDD5637233.1 16S rRNA (cytosine(1402)-N(4))-methyltransferase RsmH [Atribacterota bacterium]
MTSHIPVMPEQVLVNLITRKTGIYVDCTLGGGGHAQKIIEKIYPEGWLVGFDQDIEALEFTREKLKDYQDRIVLVKANFSDLEIVLHSLGFAAVSGIFFDLGISSHQVDTPYRGFSFNKESLLDMRMDLSEELDARYVVNRYSERQLAEIFSRYGEERFSRSLARIIVEERKRNSLETTSQLAQLITNFYAKHKKGKWRLHPATKVFQAIRIEVNKELSVLKEALFQAIRLLEQRGRIGVISYHSLEDRVVKNTFREWEKQEIINQYGYGLRRLFKKPIYPVEEEIRQNPRARSARMRLAEKICV